MKTDILTIIEAFSKASGLSPSSVCLKAVNNHRLHRRLLRRREQDAITERKLLEWAATQPFTLNMVTSRLNNTQAPKDGLLPECEQ